MTRDRERLEALVDLFLLVGEYTLVERVQRFLIVQLRNMGEECTHLVPSALGKLVGIFILQGDYAKAQPIAEEALSLCSIIHGEDSLETAEQLHNLAGLAHCQYVLSDALPLYQQVLDIKSRLLPPGHEEVNTF